MKIYLFGVNDGESLWFKSYLEFTLSGVPKGLPALLSRWLTFQQSLMSFVASIFFLFHQFLNCKYTFLELGWSPKTAALRVFTPATILISFLSSQIKTLS